MSTTKYHVAYESWCERAHLIAFDFDTDIVGVGSQPFRFEFTGPGDVFRGHVTDFFLRNADRGRVVVDVKVFGGRR